MCALIVGDLPVDPGLPQRADEELPRGPEAGLRYRAARHRRGVFGCRDVQPDRAAHDGVLRGALDQSRDLGRGGARVPRHHTRGTALAPCPGSRLICRHRARLGRRAGCGVRTDAGRERRCRGRPLPRQARSWCGERLATCGLLGRSGRAGGGLRPQIGPSNSNRHRDSRGHVRRRPGGQARRVRRSHSASHPCSSTTDPVSPKGSIPPPSSVSRFAEPRWRSRAACSSSGATCWPSVSSSPQRPFGSRRMAGGPAGPILT